MESSGQEIPVPAANFVAVLHDIPPLPKNNLGARLTNQRGWQPAPVTLARRGVIQSWQISFSRHRSVQWEDERRSYLPLSY
jgi:hypothetical protein